MSQCGKCVTNISNVQESIVCVECKNSYHVACVNIRSAKLPTIRNSWKCEVCVSDPGSDSSRVSDIAKEQAVSMAAILQGIENLSKDMAQQFVGVNNNVTDVKTQLSAINETIANMKLHLDALAIENEARKNDQEELKKENAELKTEVASLKIKVEDIEQYSRRDNVEIVGVPFTQKENIYVVLDSIARVLDIPFDDRDVSVAHRLPDSKKTGKPNIIVKFVTRYAKNGWVNAARGCKHLTADKLCTSWEPTRVYVNDHLTFTNKRLLGQLRGLLKEKRIVGAWSRDCRVMMRVRAEGPVYHIKEVQDIEAALSVVNTS